MKAYTVGLAKSYDKALSDSLESRCPVKKIGIRPDLDPPYTGGSCWSSFVEASEVADRNKDYAVYEIDIPGGWNECTHVVDGELSRSLLVDAVIRGRADGA